MTTVEEPVLTVHLFDAATRAVLTVERPHEERQYPATFSVPWPGEAGRSVSVTAQVQYTTATNTGTGWSTWHVKIYRCEDADTAVILSGYLRRQALDIQHANRILPSATGSILPPWAIVPVHIVLGSHNQELVDGPVTTRLGVTTSVALTPARVALPSWYAADEDATALTVLAVSPHVDTASFPESTERRPAVRHLPMFSDIAQGLDALHAADVIHCDVKPDNVRKVVFAGVGAKYTMIDADAVTRIEPPPPRDVLRSTPLYQYAGLAAVPADRRPSSQTMLAHDRFGFALVVLAALAGRNWVDGLLRSTHPKTGARLVDDPAEVAAALRRLWADTPKTSWQPLIDVLVEPFTEPTLQARAWSAARWLERLLRAVNTPNVPPGVASGGRYASDLRSIQRRAGGSPAVRTVLVDRGCAAAQEAAMTRARSAALTVAAGWVAVFMIAAVVLAVGALVWGK